MTLEQGGVLMFIQIEPDSDIPIYTQLTNQLIELVARGEIKEGFALPSVRSLAADLGVNMHTVNKSYHELEIKGIIRIIPKSGAIINPPPLYGILPLHRERIISEFRPKIAESLVLGMMDEEILAQIKLIISDLKGGK